MKKVKPVLQHDETDCGAACISMILNYYGSHIPLRKIRAAAGTDKYGTSGFGIQKAAEQFGLSCQGFASPNKEDLENIPLPALFHLHNKSQDHYVVLCRIKKQTVFINDPAKGAYTLSLAEFKTLWSGIFFLLSPSPAFRTSAENEKMISSFLHLLKPHKALLCSVIISTLLLSLFGVFISFYFRYLIDEVLYSQAEITLNICSLCYLIVIVFQSLITFCRSQIIMHLSAKIDVSLTSDFFCHLLHLPLSFFSARKTGEILSRTGDIQTIQGAVSSTTLSVVMDAIMIFVGGAFLLKMGGPLIPIAVAPVVCSAVVVWIFASPFKKQIREHAISEAEKNACLYESINGVATIKALASEKRAFMRAERRIVDAAEKNMSLAKLGIFQNSIQAFISGTGTLALYWYGSKLIFSGALTLGQLISFITLSGFFLSPLSRLLTMQSYWQEVSVSAHRLLDILDMEEEHTKSEHQKELEACNKDILFEHVSFSYGTRGNAVTDVSLSIPAGKKVAFVGMSGSGKTTLLKLLMRFYSCTEGKISMGDTDIAQYDMESYRSHIGYVPQESLLFSGSIFENISWGTPATSPEAVTYAAEQAQATSFIEHLPDSYQTIIGEQGASLSGGERQRIALARTLLRSPDLLVLDEATASLDAISERAIIDTVFNTCKNKTVLMVAHRLSTVQHCDCIFVFEKGSLCESGTHKELLAKKGVYARLWEAQNNV